MRVRNVSPTGFEIQMDEWDYLDGYHVVETIDYLAVLPGSHVLGGLNVEARSIELDHNWQTLNWEQEFTQAPVVFSQITSVNEASAAITRMRAITNSRVQIRIDEEEKNDRRHASEQVHMIAIQPGKGVIGDKTVLVGKTGNTVAHNWTPVVFSEPVLSPLLIGGMQTTNGGDPATIRYRNLQSTQVEMHVDEEQSANTEVADVNEAVGWLLIAR